MGSRLTHHCLISSQRTARIFPHTALLLLSAPVITKTPKRSSLCRRMGGWETTLIWVVLQVSSENLWFQDYREKNWKKTNKTTNNTEALTFSAAVLSLCSIKALTKCHNCTNSHAKLSEQSSHFRLVSSPVSLWLSPVTSRFIFGQCCAFGLCPAGMWGTAGQALAGAAWCRERCWTLGHLRAASGSQQSQCCSKVRDGA